MTLLLDTHVVLWWLDDSSRLSASARTAISEEGAVLVSAVTAFEVAAKTAVGKLLTPDGFAERIAEQDMTELPLTFRHGLVVAQLPLHHRDPFDRLLIAQAQCENLTVVTADRAFADYNVQVLPA